MAVMMNIAIFISSPSLENFFLVCFGIGFVLSLISFLAGAAHLHLPAKWHLPVMSRYLADQEQRLKAWPVKLKKYPVSDEDSIGEKMVPKEICNGCVYFCQNSCTLGCPVDWQGGEYEGNLADCCPSFKGIRIRKVA